jgi:hypothetical protein
MRGGVSLAAALAIPLATAAGPFPHRDLVIFLTFGVLLATLVGQGGTLPALIRAMHVKDDGTDEEEERAVLAVSARVALEQLDELRRSGTVPKEVPDLLCKRFTAQRREIIKLRDDGQIDNTVFRSFQRLLDLENVRIELMGITGQSDIEG